MVTFAGLDAAIPDGILCSCGAETAPCRTGGPVPPPPLPVRSPWDVGELKKGLLGMAALSPNPPGSCCCCCCAGDSAVEMPLGRAGAVGACTAAGPGGDTGACDGPAP